MEEKISAIVLRSIEVGEADRLYWAFSREKGRTLVKGSGAKKLKAKLASGLEPITQSEMFLVFGRRIPIVKSVIILKQYPLIKKRFGSLALAQRATRLIEKGLGENQPEKDIYDYLDFFLDKLDQEYAKQEMFGHKMLLLGLSWKILRSLGQEPKLAGCTICGSKLPIGQSYRFVFPAGVVCANCGRSGESEMTISQTVLKAARLLASQEKEVIRKLRLEEKDFHQLVLVCERLFEAAGVGGLSLD